MAQIYDNIQTKFTEGLRSIISNSQVKRSVIEKIGPERIASLNIKWLGLPLVSKQKDDFYNQHEISGGWLVVTHSATITK